MRALNIRLWCSLTVAFVVVVFSLMPSTQPLLERNLWRAQNRLSEKVHLQRNLRFVPTGNGPAAAFLLAPRGQHQIERALALYDHGKSQKKAQYIGLAIRLLEPGVPPVEERLRSAVTRLRLEMALEGQKLAPHNDYFALNVANAHVALDRPDLAAKIFEDDDGKFAFDNYSADQLSIRLEQLAATVSEIQPTDISYQWEQCLLYIGTSGILMNEIGFLKVLSGVRRHTVALQIAEHGIDRIPRASSTLERLTSEVLVQEAISQAADTVDEVTFKLAVVHGVEKLKLEALKLGRPDLAKRWERFETFRAVGVRPGEMAASLGHQSLDLSFAGLIAIFVFSAIGLLTFVLGYIDANARNLAVLTAGILVGTFLILTFEANWNVSLGVSAINASGFLAFMLFRLPGKRTLAIGLFIASAALALGFVAVGVPVEFLARILALWAVPFLAIRYVQALPRWTGFAIAWTFALAVCYGLVRVTQWIPPESLPERLPHLLLVALMFIPWCVALIVSWT